MKHLPILRRHIKATLFAFVAIGLLFAMPACSDKKPEERQRITVTIEPLRFVVEYLAGENFEIHTITPVDANPETYQPTSKQIELLSQSAAYIRMGTLGFEYSQLRKMLSKSPHIFVVAASDGIAPLASCDKCYESPEGDPHTWTTPANMKHIATNICTALCVIDYKNKEKYEERLAQLQSHIDSIDTQIREKLDSIDKRTFLINHPSLAYFAQDYNLHQVAIHHEEEGQDSIDIAQEVEQYRQLDINKMFVQEQHNIKHAQEIAKALGIEVVKIEPLAYNWSEQMLHIARSLAQ